MEYLKGESIILKNVPARMFENIELLDKATDLGVYAFLLPKS